VKLDGPIPPGILGDVAPAVPLPFLSLKNTAASSSSTPDESSYANAARTLLQKGGWSFSTTDTMWEKGKEKLSFTLATADEPELVATANAVANFWSAAGIHASVQVYPISELNTSVIRPRNYDAVLFGEVVGPSSTSMRSGTRPNAMTRVEPRHVCERDDGYAAFSSARND